MQPFIRFLVDENLPVDVVDALTSFGFDTLYIRTSRYRGVADEIVWQLAVDQQRILVTRDLDFPLTNRQQPAGLLLIRVPDWYRRHQIGALVREFLEIHGAELLLGQITVARPGGEPRNRPFRA